MDREPHIRQDDTVPLKNLAKALGANYVESHFPEPRCLECGNPLVHEADLEDGYHFLCDEGSADGQLDLLLGIDEDFDEGGESGPQGRAR